MQAVLSLTMLAIQHQTPTTIIQMHLMIHHRPAVQQMAILSHLLITTNREEVLAAATQMLQVEAAHRTDHKRHNRPMIVPVAIHQINQTKTALFKFIQHFHMYFMYNFVNDPSSTSVQVINAAIATLFRIVSHFSVIPTRRILITIVTLCSLTAESPSCIMILALPTQMQIRDIQ